MRAVINKAKIVVTSEKGLDFSRNFMLHSSCAGFAADFAHYIFGKSMIFVSFWERIEGFDVRYSALAAVVIVYIDGHKERLRRKMEKVEGKIEEMIHGE